MAALEIGQLVNGGGLLAFVVITYKKLDAIVKSLEVMSTAIAKMEERGTRLQRPTPRPYYARPPTETGLATPMGTDPHTPQPQ